MAWWQIASGPDAGLPGSGILAGRSEAVASYGAACLKVRDLLASDNAAEAVSVAIPAAEQFPHGIDIHRLMGIAYLNQSDHFNARRAFDIALEGDPGDLVAQVGVAEVEEALEGPAVALRAWRRAWEIEPGTETIASRLREVQRRIASEGQAAAYGIEGQIDGPIPHTHASIVRTHLRSGLFEHAMLEAVTALTQDKSRTDVQLLLAEAWWRSGETEIAHSIAASILEKFPFCVVANLLVALHRRVVSRDPRQQIERTREADPFDRIASSLFMGRDIPPLFDDQPVNGSWSTVRSATGSWPVVMGNSQARPVMKKAEDVPDQPSTEPLASDGNAIMALPAPLIEKLPSIGDEAPAPAELILEKDDAPAIAEDSTGVAASPESEPVLQAGAVASPIPNVPALPAPAPEQSKPASMSGPAVSVDPPVAESESEDPATPTSVQETPAHAVGLVSAGDGTKASEPAEPSQATTSNDDAPTKSPPPTLSNQAGTPSVSAPENTAEPDNAPVIGSVISATSDQHESATSGDTIARLQDPASSLPHDIPEGEATPSLGTPPPGSTVDVEHPDRSPTLVPVTASQANVLQDGQALIINDQNVGIKKTVAITDVDGLTIRDLREAGALASQQRNFTEAIRLYAIAISRIRAEAGTGRR